MEKLDRFIQALAHFLGFALVRAVPATIVIIIASYLGAEISWETYAIAATWLYVFFEWLEVK